MNIARIFLALTLLCSIPMFPRAEPNVDSEPVTVIAHFDFIPNLAAQGLSALQQLVRDSKSDPGVRSFLLITWAPTTNHYQLIEIYDSLQAFNNHVQATHTIASRMTIQSLIGSPYDERRYVASTQSNDR